VISSPRPTSEQDGYFPAGPLLDRGRHFANLTRQSKRPCSRSRTASRNTVLAMGTALVLVTLLSLAAAPRRTGDAHQYLVMGVQLSQLRAPSLAAAEAARYQSWFASQPAPSGFPDGARAIRQPALVREGRQEFSHFWLYPLLGAPAIVLTNALAMHSLSAFILTNALLLGAALWAAARAFNPLAAWVVLASPLVWFIGRAQVEVFTVSLLTLSMAAAARRHWGWAAIALAIASTQNAPIAAAVPLVCLPVSVDWIHQRRLAGLSIAPNLPVARRALLFAVAAAGISLLHPAYYLWRLGVFTPQQLNGGISDEVPSLARYLAPILDPDIGLMAWLPLVAALVAIGVVSALRSNRDAHSLLPLICGLAIACWFLFVFAQTTNINSGGTIHVSRYVLWLTPLALPAIDVATRPLHSQTPGLSLIAAMCVFAVYLGYFHPDQPERYVEHSPQAVWLMKHAPALYHPLPEVFVERTLHIDGGPSASAADPACRLILLVATQPDQPCVLTDDEKSRAAARFAEDATAVWIRRGGDGANSVLPAARQP
jgi:hypothetical protein